jgi:hypothetical protein
MNEEIAEAVKTSRCQSYVFRQGVMEVIISEKK